MKLLITGASGLLGLNAAVACRGNYDVTGSVYANPIALADVRTSRVDIADAAAVRAWIVAEHPDVVLHTAGLTNVEGCQTQPDLARVLNADAAGHVAEAAAAVGARLIHVSTDHLFDGRGMLYRETDRPTPLNVYAETKLEAERLVARAHPGALILRTNFYGWGHRLRSSFSDWILSALRRGAPLSMFHDVYFTPMLVNDLVDAALELSDRGATGIYHVAGGERLSKHAFAIALAVAFGFDSSCIQAVSVDSFSFKARRPHDMSLACDRAAAALGRQMPGAREGLRRLVELESEGLPALLNSALTDTAIRSAIVH